MSSVSPKLFTISQAAAYLGVSTGTVRRWAKKRQLKGLKVGSRGDWRFTESELQKMIKRGETVAEIALQAELEYKTNLFEAQKEATPDGLLIVDQQGKMISHNKKFIDMWKIPHKIMETNDDEAALTFVVSKLLDPGGFIKQVQSLYADPRVSRDEIYFKDGRIFDRYSAPVTDKHGNYYGYAWYFRDVTRQKKLEKQKDEFLAIASHELKTPLTSLKIYGQLLQSMFETKGDTKAVQQLRKMDIQINKLNNLIADLLDVTKIQGGKLQLNKEQFDFNGLVNEIVEELERTTDKHTIMKKFAKSVTVYGDRDRLGQVLTNLLSNAIKYSPHAEKIVVKTQLVDGSIICSIQDFGVGISEKSQTKVFERFFRVEESEDNTFPGLGLGLYISSEIVRRHQGKIWVKSIKGKGSIFSFSLDALSLFPTQKSPGSNRQE